MQIQIPYLFLGVTTIAGGKWNREGHVDGPSEDAKFSNDFEVVYIGSSCSLLVVDRGNQAIREIQLHFDDCACQYETVLPLGRTCHYLSLHLLFFFSEEDNNLICRLTSLLSQDHLMTSLGFHCRNCSAFCCWFLWLHARITAATSGSDCFFHTCEFLITDVMW